MRIACIGAGPAGLYFAILMKLRDQRHEITVYECNPANHTYGWGLVFWDDLLENLNRSDAITARQVSAQSSRWGDQRVCVVGRGEAWLGGDGYSIGRRRLLDILVGRATELGVKLRFDHQIDGPTQLPNAELVVACDGVGSRLRGLQRDSFGTNVRVHYNKYLWLGTSKVFADFTFAFVETVAGWIWFHAYAFDSTCSTCIVECSEATWTGLGFDRLNSEESLRTLNALFEQELDSRALISREPDLGRAPWASFREVTNEKWHVGNLVLMGDAAHTTHFTIGSGTKLALEDAIGLSKQLDQCGDLHAALEAYGKDRRAAMAQLRTEARRSAQWFENVPRYIGLEVPQFAELLNQRRSVLLATMSPARYFQLHEVTRKVPALRRVRELAGATRRDIQTRRLTN